MPRFSLLTLLALFLLSSPSPASDVPSGYRIALLLGNSDYPDFTLRGVDGSLDHVERGLMSQGFTIVRHENLNQQQSKDAIAEFTASVPTNSVVVFYYIGLAAHVKRFDKMYNLMRPVGEKIESDNDYRSRGLNVLELVESLRERSGARINLLFLDACHESPIRPEKGEVNGGLIEFEVGDDTAVMFAAAGGQQSSLPASDAATPFARALVQNASKLNDSVKAASEAIAAVSGKSWIGGAAEAGIGQPSDLPVADVPRDGKTPGEGYANSVGMTFRWCPSGRFSMGSDKTDSPATRDRKPVEVTLSKGFWMGEHEVTQREYSVVMRRNPPTGFTKHRNAPFWGVTESKSITDFCRKLNDLERKAGQLPNGWEYIAPTEAEWEYACRAGSPDDFCFGDAVADLGRYGNFADRTLRMVNPNYYWADPLGDDGVAEGLALVGSYRPNKWGLRDMHGNVSEIVADHLVPELPGGIDPLVRIAKEGKTQIRGGAWCSRALYCESSFRNAAPSRDKHNFVGFRVVLKKVK